MILTNVEIKKAKLILNPNYSMIPVTQLKMNDTNMEIFNAQVKKCKEYFNIVRTPSGYISRKTRFPSFDVRHTTSCVELTVLDKSGMYRIQFRNSGEVGHTMDLAGRNCFHMFKNLCLKHNINLDSYAIDNGQEVKTKIEKYIIKLEQAYYVNLIWNKAHHVDFHSSFPSGLIATHPEFKPVIEELYNGRKTNPEYKLVLNSTIGYMQSMPCCKAKWANLSKDAINNNNDRIRELAQRLKDNGRVVLAYNTDGIWYTGDIYHGEGEGPSLGQWENDHVNCKLRFKSAGSYEFIENNEYHAVVRGHTNLDEIKPRSEWTWGDIYNFDAQPIRYALTTEGLIIKINKGDDNG